MPKEHVVQCYVFDFTFSRKKSELPNFHEFIKLLRPLFKKWAFQKEYYPSQPDHFHFQGRGSLFKKKRLNELKVFLNTSDLSGMYVSESSTENHQNECFYVLKLDTRVAGPWTDVTYKVPEYIPRQYRGLMDRLYPYQKAILDTINDFDDRGVNILVDFYGNNGKSTVARLGMLHHRALKLPVVSDAKELTQAACDILMSQQNREPGLCFVDMPRGLTVDPKKFGPFMIAVEEIKGGYVDDCRNHYKGWWFDSPSTWVFCNHMPLTKLLSKDRFTFWIVTATKHLQKVTKQELSQMSQDYENRY